MWRPKQSLRNVFRLAENAARVEALPARWYSWTRRARLEPFKRLVTTIRAHLPGIPARFESRVSNGPVESTNWLIQTARTRARGCRNVENLIDMTFLVSGRLLGTAGELLMIARMATPI